MDVEIPVLSGFLNVPTQSGFSLNRISKKKSTQRYCLLFKSSRHGIERLEICESKDDKNPKIITLENCVKITQEPAPANQIQIVKMTGTLTLNTLTEDELKEWVTALQTVAFRDKVNGNNNNGGTGRNAAIEEDNDLYCSSFGDGLFIVQLIQSEASKRCQFEQKSYMLHLTATELQLKSAEDLNIIIAKWPYRFIRKYGYRDGKFTFEAGRKCSTGEGVFTLDHTNPQEIFRCMAAKMKSMKKLISGDSSLDCGENQLTAALSMEAGSRSPLPPSPNHHQSVSDFDQSLTQSCASIRGFLSSNDSLNNVSINSNASNSNNSFSPLLKLIPNKPPRKLPLTSTTTIVTSSSSTQQIATSPTSPVNCQQFINNNNNNNNSNNNNNTTVTTSSTSSCTTLLSSTSISTATTTDKQLQQQPQQQQQNCDMKFRKYQGSYEPVSITNDSNKNQSAVVLKSPSPVELLNNRASPPLQQIFPSTNNTTNITNNSSSNDKPPDLPLRNDNSSIIQQNKIKLTGNERDYECIENITDAWRTLGMSEIKHIEHMTTTTEDDLIDFVWQRTQSQRENGSQKLKLLNSHHSTTATTATTSSITTLNTNRTVHDDNDTDSNYDRLDFLSPNHKNSSGYKTIVTVTQGNHKKKENINSNSQRDHHQSGNNNDYELIANPDMQSCRLADDSYLGYGVLRKPSLPGPQVPSSNSHNTKNITKTAIITDDTSNTHLGHKNYNGMSYAMVSKPKRV